MKKQKILPWVLLGISLFGGIYPSLHDFISKTSDNPSVAVKVGNIELQSFKGTALMLQPQPPLIDPKINDTITLPPVNFTMLPEIPTEINASVLANESRSFMLVIPDITIDARYMSIHDWWMIIKLYGHEEGVETWTLFMTHNQTAFFSDLWDYTEIDENHWVATQKRPIKIYINLQYIIWKTLSDVYPLHIAIDIRVEGIIELSCDVTGCDYMVSDPYQQSIRVVAP